MANERPPLKTRSLSRTYLNTSLFLIAILTFLIVGVIFWIDRSVMDDKLSVFRQILLNKDQTQMKREVSALWNDMNTILKRSGKKKPGTAEFAQLIVLLKRNNERSPFLNFLMKGQGQVIYYPDLTGGKDLLQFYDSAGHSVNHALFETARQPEGGMVSFRFLQEDSDPDEQIAYVVYIKDWDCILGLSLKMAMNEKILAENRDSLRHVLVYQVMAVLGLIGLFLLIAILLLFRITLRVNRETRFFIDFFRDKSIEHRQLDYSSFRFTEFRTLGEYANRMNAEVDEQREKLLNEINEKRLTEAELLKFSSAIDQSSMIVMITDLEGKIEYVNSKFTDVTGYDLLEVVGKPAGFQRTPGSLTDYHQLWDALKHGRYWDGEFYNRRKNGDSYWESASISPIRGANGTVTHYLKVASDVTERKILEKNLEYMAHHDTLTGLPNRLLFSDRLGVSLSVSRRNDTYTALMILDLDNFKTVNDTLGHDAGDILLKMVVSRFKLYIREQDTASRMGGDEFTFILSSLKEKEDGIRIAERIVESFQRPFDIQGQSMLVTASLGMSFFPVDGETPSILMKHADQALYMAKDRGKNNVQVFKQTFEKINLR